MTLKINGATGGSVSIDAPDNTSPAGTDVTLTLPTSAGSSGQYLQTNGTGTLSWQTVASDAITEGNTTVECVDTGSNGHITFDTEGSERARIDSSGRLLVGTTSSSSNSRLVLQGTSLNASGEAVLRFARGEATPADGTSTGAIIFTDSSQGEGGLINGARDGGTWSASSKPTRLLFSTCANGSSTPTERMRIRSNGIVDINRSGATSPTSDPQQLFIGEGGTNNFAIMVMQTGGNSGANRDYIRFYNYQNNLAGSIQHNGMTSVNYSTSSDYRLKENIAPVSDGIERLLQLKPSRFNFIAEPEKTVDGFIAHEVQQIVPEAINGEKDGVDSDGNPVYQGIDQSKLVPLLTAALQEAIAKIETLEARLTALEGGAA